MILAKKFYFFKLFWNDKRTIFSDTILLSHKHNKNNSNKNLIINNKNHFMLRSTALLNVFCFVDGMNNNLRNI